MPTSGKIRFVVVDDHELVRDGIVARLKSSFLGCAIVFAGDDVGDAVRAAVADGCDCAIVDLDLGTSSTPAEVVSAFVLRGVPVLVVSALATVGALNSALASGALGFVSKNSTSKDLETAIRAVVAGKRWISPDLAGLALRNPDPIALSAQEQRALALYASGMTTTMVARRMGVSASTVKYYIDQVRSKYESAGIEARTKVELNAVARERGLLP